LNLSLEELKLLEDSYLGFIRHGANLSASNKQLYRKLTEELSLLSLQYGQNILKETGNYQLHLTDKKEVIGIPEGDLEAASLTAKAAGKEGWVFTLQAPSFMPFMKYQCNRELRKELYIAYNTRCTKEGEYNNYPLVVRMVNLRREIAQLLGFKDYAEYVLQRRMAENEKAVFKLLDELLIAYRPTAVEEVKAIQQLAQELDGLDPSEFCGWDLAYYANLLKERKFQLNDEQLKPYFPLQNVISGIFGLATRLYGITFQKSTTIPVYHPDVETFEVFDKDGTFLAVLYTDFFPREGKRPGAWMTEYKGQWLEKKTSEKGTSIYDSRPHVSLVMNFTKPTESKPALLTLGEVETFLHEFGHSLHGMFAQATYASLSGTNVYWDFVELPSQFMENFATEKEFLATFAQHYKTGETIPAELIERVKKASNFNVAYGCLRQLSFGLLDMAWYTLSEAFEGDTSAIRAFEKAAMKSTSILPPVAGACMSVQFSHIFAGGYSAGYYSYKWAEVLDADAFSLFKEKGIFNRELADAFRKNVLSKGGTEHPMVLYKRFRGQEPTIDALLKRNGIINNPE
ncbi:MAG: M3 family metallopeptidase, partial [Bacteroidaceae bacterium]